MHIGRVGSMYVDMFAWIQTEMGQFCPGVSLDREVETVVLLQLNTKDFCYN